MFPNYDIIGDIHGRAEKLEEVLGKLGYVEGTNGYAHPDGRQVVFLGDFVDRGTGHKTVMQIVRAMVDNGQAQAIMGNHEFNAICYATQMDDGEYIRKHTDNNTHQHQLFLNEYPFGSDEYKDVIAWFKKLPVKLEFGEFRCIHACWDDDGLDVIKPYLDADDCLIEDAYTHYGEERQPIYDALESVMKSPEIDLPVGLGYNDLHGHYRTKTRQLWWRDEPGMEVIDRIDLRFAFTDAQKDQLNAYQGLRSNFMRQAKPTFVGHYSLPHANGPEYTDTVAVLDYAKYVTGYRWENGTPDFKPASFVFSS